MIDGTVLDALAEARREEKEQALFYRALAAAAEAAERLAEAERLNELHADEQHQLSRLTARLIELGGQLEELADVRAPEAPLDGWEDRARDREAEEVGRYESLLSLPLDAYTRALVEECLAAERGHAQALGGKWMSA
jgi:rubrerythrin